MQSSGGGKAAGGGAGGTEWREAAERQLLPADAPLPRDIRPESPAAARRTLQNSTYLGMYDNQPKIPSVEEVLATLAKVASPYDVAAFKKTTYAPRGHASGTFVL